MAGGSFSVIARGISIARADRRVLVDVDVTVTERTRMAVVGPNGVGKSTLLAVLAGEVAPDAGTVTSAPASTTIGFVRQELDRDVDRTVRMQLAIAAGVDEADRELEAATGDLASGANGADDRYAAALDHWLAVGAADFEGRVGEVWADLGQPEAVLDLPLAALSGGQAARVGLAAVMLSRFGLTLLDEPTNDLDLDGLDRLERWVTGHRGGLVVVSHDRAFLERVVTSVLEIDEHHHTASLFDGGWAAYLAERATMRAHAEADHASFIAERDRLAQRAQRQREWADQGIGKAKKTPDGDKFRRAFQRSQSEKLASKSAASERAIQRLDVVEKPWEGWELRFRIATAERSAAVVASLDGAVVRRGDFVLGPIDLELRWAERVAIVGPNGSGKSTLIDTVLGRHELEAGTSRLGSGVVVGQLDQARGQFQRDDDASVLQCFEAAADLDVSEARSVLAKFGLDADAVQRPARSLSPGERTRAQLALFQARGVNLVVLDEPTNHLDLPAIEQLESALADYDGTLIVVSHDRRFLESLRIDRIVDVARAVT